MFVILSLQTRFASFLSREGDKTPTAVDELSFTMRSKNGLAGRLGLGDINEMTRRALVGINKAPTSDFRNPSSFFLIYNIINSFLNQYQAEQNILIYSSQPQRFV